MKVFELFEEAQKEALSEKSEKIKKVLIQKMGELTRAEKVVKSIKEDLEKFKREEVESVDIREYLY